MRMHELTAIMTAILASGREPGSINFHQAVLLTQDALNLQKAAILASAEDSEKEKA